MSLQVKGGGLKIKLGKNTNLKTCKKNKFEDLAYFEPYYLKDFMSTNR
jgi:hypothetical protein